VKTANCLLIPIMLLAAGGCSSNHPPAREPGLRPAPAHGTDTGSAPSASGLKFAAQNGWISEDLSSSMRKVQYRLPKADGDSEDAQMVVFYFQGGGGGVQANIDRWTSQFTKPDGSPATDQKTTHKVSNGIPITVVDVGGTYVAGMGSTTGGAPRPGFRMIAAVAESANGPWFFKLTGPAKTVARWEPSFQAFLDSIEP
jgi:hypothetical protein